MVRGERGWRKCAFAHLFAGRRRRRITYQNANDGNQENDFHQAVKDEEDAAENHLGQISIRVSENGPSRGM